MISYDADIRMFVVLYDTSRSSSLSLLKDTTAILDEAGFVPQAGGGVSLSVPGEGRDPLPMSMPVLLNGGKAFLEWKILPEIEGPALEFQLSAATAIPTGIFSDRYYSPEIRDRLVCCLERLCSLAGFSVGFEVSLGEDFAAEDIYREYFDECVVDGRLSLGRLMHHGYLPLYSLFVGQPYLGICGEEVFIQCPAWRVSRPSNDAVCLFLHNLFPTGMLAIRHEQSYVREGLAHLRNALGRE